ncbi:MAG TPA: type IV secretion system DNA-binding domain-containing protein [Candidatus Paceibacterota bacterium]
MVLYEDNPERITYFGQTDARGKRIRFGIKAKDRSKHMYVIGKTGMGKSTLLENMAIQDIQNGEGMAFIDPHGSTAEKLLDYIPEDRIKDVIYFAPFDMDYPVAFNVMEDVGYDKRHLVVSGLMSAFKKIWVDSWSARMEYILSNTLLALLEYPDATLLDVNRMYTNKAFRKRVVDNIKDPLVRAFWVDEFATYTDRYTQEATPAIQNKIGQFTSNPLIRNIVGQAKSTFDLRDVMDNKKIFIANLSKGRMGETNADLLGSMLTTKIYLSAMSRADLSAQKLAKLPNFFFYVDEFQSIANESFADILSEARKYKLNLVIAHQYIEQMEENVRNAVFGNVGTTIAFRVGPFDAEVLETVFSPKFVAEDLVNLGFAQIYLSLMIDGVGSRPFSATTLPPIELPHLSYKDQITQASRVAFARERALVEGEVEERTKTVSDEAKEGVKGEEKKGKSITQSTSRPVVHTASSRRTVSAPRRLIETTKTSETVERVQKDLGQQPTAKDDTSLRELLSKTQARIPQKKLQTPSPANVTGSEQHLRELRSTLARIAKGSGKKDTKSSFQKKSNSLVRPVTAPPRQQESKNSGAKPKEVPEDVLRKLLDVEKG